MNHPRFRFLLLQVFVVAVAVGAFAKEEEKVSVHFRDIHRDGKVAVLGHFGIPIGQKVRVEGTRAKASKTSNNLTLHFTKVNGVKAPKLGESPWPPLIQIRNVDTLPEDVTITLEGYEALTWVGDPEKNWRLDVDFIVTRVVAPVGLKVNASRSLSLDR
jgi:hypothetical protein